MDRGWTWQGDDIQPQMSGRYTAAQHLTKGAGSGQELLFHTLSA